MICLLILLIAQHDFFRQAPKLRRVRHFSPVLAQFLLYPFRKSREIVVVIITYNIDNSRHIAAAIIILVQKYHPCLVCYQPNRIYQGIFVLTQDALSSVST